jgi:protocatechuate 3,4-dioxygenase beta subunit
MHSDDDHDGGLGRDLRLFRDGLIARRRALSLIGMAAGSVAIASGSSLLFPRAALGAPGSCSVPDAPEIAGPFPADGTNHANGETSDVLTESGVVRRDVRRSFLSTNTKARGVKIHLKLKLVNTNAQCAPLSGYALYFWHCDRDGLYSLYTIPQESYLRGVQVSDENGKLDFVTVFPGCYPGRWPHLHLENFTSLAQATNGHNALLTTQLALPADVCADVYNNAKGYRASRDPFSHVSIAGDVSFGDNTQAQMEVMTPKFRGSIDSGFVATATVGIPV